MSQPPCEAVSWNIFLQLFQLCSFRSASLWGCELKYGTDNYNCKSSDVSLLVRLWVEISKTVDVFGCCLVSLLVRLWVEMFCVVLSNGMSWVSLLVRLWVEIVFAFMCSITLFQSASLWGCELKCACTHVYRGTLPSASLWGCELKYQDRSGINIVSVSASLWGCELKCSLCDHRYMSYLVSLLVRLWVEIMRLNLKFQKHGSASLWGCELKWLDENRSVSTTMSASLWGCELKYSILW